MRGRAVHENHNPTQYIYSLLPLTIYLFILDACMGHIFKSTKGIEMNIGLKIDGIERKCTAQEP